MPQGCRIDAVMLAPWSVAGSSSFLRLRRHPRVIVSMPGLSLSVDVLPPAAHSQQEINV
jgi:hypothetical protein